MKKLAILLLALLLAGCRGQVLAFTREDGAYRAFEQGEIYTLEAHLPQVNRGVDGYSLRRAQKLARDYLARYQERVEELTDPQAREQEGAWVLNGENTAWQDFISLVLVEYSFLPGSAHGDYAIETRLFRGRKAVGLEALFLPETEVYGVLSPLARQALLEKLGEEADVAWVDAGTEARAENFSAFTVGEEGLTLIFAPYQVGPWALGQQRITLPWSALEPWLKKN